MKIKKPVCTSRPARSPHSWLSPTRVLFGLSALSVAVTGATNVLAQDQRTSAGMLEEVLVTATRRTESQQDVAVSVTALTDTYLESRGIANFSDLNKAASNLYLVQTENATASTLRIRGVGVRPNSGLDEAVGVLQDDVYQARPGFSFQELMDVASVEVLRGPQGTLFGKNTTAGVIKINTTPPNLEEFSGKVQAVGGNYDNAEVRGVVNVPIIDGKLAARFSGFDAQRDGYTENRYNNEETRNMDRYGYRGKLRWDPTDALNLDFSYEKMKQRSDLDSALVLYGPAGIAQMESAGFDVADYPVELGKTQEDIHGRSWDQVDRYIARVEWDAGEVVARFIGAYEKVETFIRNDQNRNITTIGFPTAAVINQNNSKITTFEFQLASDIDGPLSWIGGVFFQQNKLESYTTLLNTQNVNIPGRFGPPTNFTDPYYWYPRPVSAREDKSYAGFGTVRYEFTDRISASFGARYSDDQKENSGAPGTYKDFKEWTYSGDVKYQFTDNVMVYVAAQKGFTSGGFNRPDVVAAAGEEYASFEPVTTYNYEIGLKSEWFEQTLRLNVTAFTQEFDDYQVTQSLTSVGNVLITNAAKVTSDGVEADFTWLATEHLTFDGSLAYTNTEYDDFKDGPCGYIYDGAGYPPGKCTQNAAGDWAQDLSGETLDNAPEWTGNVGGEYRNNFFIGNLEWFARADAVYRDDAYLDQSLDPASKQGSYTLYNARLGIESMDQGWKVTAWGNNLGDKDYGIYALTSEVGYGLTMWQGLPRTYGVTLDYAF